MDSDRSLISLILLNFYLFIININQMKVESTARFIHNKKLKLIFVTHKIENKSE